MDIDKEPVGFELKIFKWVFLPIVVLSVVWLFIDASIGRHKCESVCAQKGYFGFRYTPSDRYGVSGNTCDCLTETESKMKNRVPEGTRVY